MWSKIYFAILGLSIAVMAFFTYYAWSWLQSIGLPAAAAAGYEYHAALAWPALWISVFLLLMLANAIMWTSGRAWPLWSTFLYFAVFAIARYFWLTQTYGDFGKKNGFSEGGYSADTFFAVILIAFMAIVVFTDQFVITRLRARTHPDSAPAPAETPVAGSDK